MKTIKSLFAFAKKSSTDKNPQKSVLEKWSQIKLFADFFGETFHSQDEENIIFIKKNSALLVEKVEALTVESLPCEYRNPKLIQSLITLKKESNTINLLVIQNANDDLISEALKKLKSTYIKILDICNSENK